MEEKIKEAKKRLEALQSKQRESLLKLQSPKKEKACTRTQKEEKLYLDRYATSDDGKQILTQTKEQKMNTKKIVCAVAYVGIVVATFIIAGGLEQYIDLNSIIVVVVIALLFALGVNNDETFIQKFGNGAVRAGWLGSIIGIVAIFGSDIFANGDLPMLGAAMAVCSLTVLYGYFIKLGAMILD